MEYKHSVSLDLDKCKGCTHCLRRCPTEAIRIRDGHAAINAVQCIDCGECIRVCPYKAKRAICDTLEDLDHSKYLIALPAPSLFGQFINVTDVDYVLQGLLDMGFDDVFEVSRCAEIITEYTRRYMKRRDIPRPAISSACPVVVRLITIRFPSLIDHIVPLMPPIELAGRMAKEEAMKKHPELKKEDIKTVFISPCPAKFSWVKNGDKEDDVPCVDYVVAISEVYFKLLNALKPQDTPKIASETGMIGLGWASSGGEGSALMNDRYLAADGIDYKGFIFLGLMNDGGNPYVIEYNVRMGDPETEAVMTRIEGDFADLLDACADGRLHEVHYAKSDMTAVTVMLVSGGYPEAYKKGMVMSGLDTLNDVVAFHAGTAFDADNQVVTSGGRVIAVTAHGTSIEEARDIAYREAEKIHFEGVNYRHDIGLDLMKMQ